ncbi:hypothetical protein ACFC1I_10895 [Microbacterium sp. NPDC056044]|uniref:hypothetical protein n=1 Tax=Microbacterium sp. NPDC056044 TaxID=3345690 RepID=UPI0035DF95BA
MRKPLLPALIAGAVGFVAVSAPAAIVSWTVPPPSSSPAFPTEVATYSWFVAHGDLGTPATMIYQNGIGVEFMDSPQAVALGVDGSTYRRIGAAEQRSTPTDQGDPAAMVLSADGTFAVIAGANGHGDVLVRSLVDGTDREVPIGAGRSVVPLSIASDGDHVLVLLADSEMSSYTDPPFSGTLAMLELSTGDLLEYSVQGVTSAALSPDGSRIAAQTSQGAVMMDASGRSIRELPAELRGQAFGDDAWSPGGTRLMTLAHDPVWVEKPTGRTLTSAATLLVSDVSAGTTTKLALTGVEYAAALGWRDDDTIVLQAYADDNSSEFRWVDAGTGATQSFSTYESGFTAASIGSADLARDLISEWAIEDRAVNQGWTLGIIGGIAVGGAAGLIVWAVTRRRSS